MKKLLLVLSMSVFVPIMAINKVGFAEEARAEDLNSAYEVKEYGHRASLERQEEKNRQIQLQQYQEREYMRHQQSMEQQYRYNPTHQGSRKQKSWVF